MTASRINLRQRPGRPSRTGNPQVGGGGGGGARSAPAANMLCWLRGDDPDSFTLSGSDITAWNDSSGNSNHPTVQGTPQLTGVMNGYDVPNIDAAEGFRLPTLTFAQTSFTIYSVVKYNTLAARYFHQYSLLIGSGQNMNLGQSSTGSTFGRFYFHGSSLTLDALTTDPQLWVVTYDAATGAYFFKIGASSVSGTIGTGYGMPGSTSHDFGQASLASLSMRGLLGEYGVIDGALTGTDLTDLITNVADTYGVAS